MCVPKIKKSKLLFGKYSYTKSFSSPWMQQPMSLTRLLCCSFAISSTSFLNSVKPCPKCKASLLTAISVPSANWPWKYVQNRRHYISLKLQKMDDMPSTGKWLLGYTENSKSGSHIHGPNIPFHCITSISFKVPIHCWIGQNKHVYQEFLYFFSF